MKLKAMVAFDCPKCESMQTVSLEDVNLNVVGCYDTGPTCEPEVQCPSCRLNYELE
jgi:hypothetical protein